VWSREGGPRARPPGGRFNDFQRGEVKHWRRKRVPSKAVPIKVRPFSGGPIRNTSVKGKPMVERKDVWPFCNCFSWGKGGVASPFSVLMEEIGRGKKDLKECDFQTYEASRREGAGFESK